MLLRELYIPPKDAIEIENPHSGITLKVDKKKAIENYKKVLTIDSGNKNALAMLEKLNE